MHKRIYSSKSNTIGEHVSKVLRARHVRYTDLIRLNRGVEEAACAIHHKYGARDTWPDRAHVSYSRLLSVRTAIILAQAPL